MYSPCSDGELNTRNHLQWNHRSKTRLDMHSREGDPSEGGASSDPGRASVSIRALTPASVPPTVNSPKQPSSSASASAAAVPGGVDLNFEEKEKIQGLVRDVLRPLYHSGKITKDEYTSINKRVSRVMYRHVFREGSGASASGSRLVTGAHTKQLAHWKSLVEHYVGKERARKITVADQST